MGFKLNFNDYLLLSKGEARDTGRARLYILADTFEALLGAIYLDQGIESAKLFVNKWIASPNLKSGKYQIDNNFKGQLLEYTHTEKLSHPNYKLVSSNGPDHKKEFIGISSPC